MQSSVSSLYTDRRPDTKLSAYWMFVVGVGSERDARLIVDQTVLRMTSSLHYYGLAD